MNSDSYALKFLLGRPSLEKWYVLKGTKMENTLKSELINLWEIKPYALQNTVNSPDIEV